MVKKILMFVAVIGLLMGSVSAAEHDFDGNFKLDVPVNAFYKDVSADGHKYTSNDGKGLTIQYLTKDDIKGASFTDYITSLGLKDGKTDGDFTVFQKDGKYVVITNSSDEMYIITDKDLNEAKAIAESADLKVGASENTASTPVNTSVELQSHDFGGKFKMDVPKGASFKESTDSEAQFNGAVVFSDSTNDLNITYVESDEINEKFVNQIVNNLEKEIGAKATKNGNLNVISAGPWNEVIFNDGNKLVMIVTSKLDLDTITSMAQSTEFTK